MLNPFSHVDIRVRSIAQALPFYECLLGALRFRPPVEVHEDQGVWQNFRFSLQEPPSQYVGLLEEPEHRANGNRVAFHVATRRDVDHAARLLIDSGFEIEGPMTCREYGSTYYAAFFADPSGNLLEVCCLREDERGRSSTWGVDHLLSTVTLPESYVIRPWHPEDFASIQRLSDLEGWTTPRLRADATRLAWERSWPALVLTHEREVVGFLRAISDFEVSTYLGEIIVARPHRGLGLGRALVTICQGLVPRTRIDLLSDGDSDAFYSAIDGQDFQGYRLPSRALGPPPE